MWFFIVFISIIAFGAVIPCYLEYYTEKKFCEDLIAGVLFAPKSIHNPFDLKDQDIIKIISKESSDSGFFVLYEQNGIKKSLKLRQFMNYAYKLPPTSRFVNKRGI